MSVKNRQPPTRLHTSQTRWEIYKNIIREKVDPKRKIKTREDIVTATEDFISTIQQAAQIATPTRDVSSNWPFASSLNICRSRSKTNTRYILFVS